MSKKQTNEKIIKGIHRGGKASLTLLNDRIELKAKGTFGAWKTSEEIKYSDITSIGIQKSITSGTVEIKYFGDKLILRYVDKREGDLFVANVKEKIRQFQNNAVSSSPMDEIKKAKGLLDLGAITQEQFEEIKDKYLKQL